MGFRLDTKVDDLGPRSMTLDDLELL